jgi:hypothetical protein
MALCQAQFSWTSAQTCEGGWVLCHQQALEVRRSSEVNAVQALSEFKPFVFGQNLRNDTNEPTTGPGGPGHETGDPG